MAKVVQTELNETEYSLLAAYAKANRVTIKDATRLAIRRLTVREDVDPNDPLFRMFPLTRKGRFTDGSDRHDAYLYGSEE
ncbi:MAG TPA: hypothetical protein VJ400_06170 [Thermoplasmata archaeon]|nr:hypothetical protein [Thermoplasmata archaeon]